MGKGIALVVILFGYALPKYELPQDIFKLGKGMTQAHLLEHCDCCEACMHAMEREWGNAMVRELIQRCLGYGTDNAIHTTSNFLV